MASFDDEMQLPSEFDVVVLGTGLVESMLAAAFARAGHSVLHVDAFEHYGGDCAGFSLDTLQKYAELSREPPVLPETVEGEVALAAANDAVRFHSMTMMMKKKAEEATEENLASKVAEDVVTKALRGTRLAVAKAQAEKRCKRFNIDLCPRLCYARGDGTDAMIALGVAPYLEFSGVKGTYYVDTETTKVPSSKRDVFTSSLPPASKRKLMRFLQAAFDASSDDAAVVNETDLTASRGLRRPQNKVSARQEASPEGQFFFEAELVSRYGLDHRMARIVAKAVALLPSESDATWTEGIAAVGRHLKALSAHVGCDSPLMAPLYGSAELPQAFCRACAVQGGVYALRTTALALQLAEETVTGVRFANQIVQCGKLIVAADYVPQLIPLSHRRTYRRLVLMLPTEKFPTLPAALIVDVGMNIVVRGTLVDASTYAVPEGVDAQILHLQTEAPADDDDKGIASLDAAFELLFDDIPDILWTWTYSWPQHAPDPSVLDDLLTKNVAVVTRQRPHFSVVAEVQDADRIAKQLGLDNGIHEPEEQPEEEQPEPSVRSGSRRHEDDEDLMLQGLVDAIEQRDASPRHGHGRRPQEDNDIDEGLVDAIEHRDDDEPSSSETPPPGLE